MPTCCCARLKLPTHIDHLAIKSAGVFGTLSLLQTREEHGSKLLQVVSTVDPFGFYTTSSLEAGLNDAFVNDAFTRMNSADQPGGTNTHSQHHR